MNSSLCCTVRFQVCLLLCPGVVSPLIACLAHQQAWQAEVLHRDVSAFNIMIYRYRDPVDNVVKYKGLLVDWGLCKFAHELKQPAVQKNRSVRSLGLTSAASELSSAAGHLAVYFSCPIDMAGQVPT